MNYLSNIYLDKDAREALMRGVNGVADAVKLTLGASGGNAILEESVYPFQIITNDGVSIAEKCFFVNPVENIGANLVKEIAQRANRESGDGTTTSVVLLQAILKEGMASEASPMDIKRSLDECLPLIYDSLEKQKKEITLEEVGQVATISAEDEKIGALLQEIYIQIGKDGIVELDNSNVPDISYEITEGVRLRNCGFMYPYMANDYVNGQKKGKTSVYKNPKILIAKERITPITIEKILRSLVEKGINELVIFCDEIDQKVSEGLAMMDIEGKFKALVIKAPTLWKDWLFEDFAKITGATIIDPQTGNSFKTIGLHHLGTCDVLTTTKDETVVRGIKDISTHIESLKEIGTDDSKLRLSWLQTKTAVLKLGANSESELSYIRLKAEDARNASYLALKGGVVVGGGVALINAALELPQTVGGKILLNSLQAPFEQIRKNAGYDNVLIPIDDLGKVNTKGLNAKTGEIVDMWEAGILDPLLVVKGAITSAISVAGTILTAKVVVTKQHEQK